MTPYEFENLVCEYYRSKGYKAEVTPYSGDYGVDVFAVKGKEKIAVQAKMYGSSSRKVNRQTIMELYGAAAYFDCTGCVLATDGDIMPDAQEVADKLKIKVLYLKGNTGSGFIASGNASVSKTTHTVKSTNTVKDTRNVFDILWSKYIFPLKGKTLTRVSGRSNTISSVDWSGVGRITSNGCLQKIKIEAFRYAVNRILENGHVTRDDINQNYTGRASSGIVLILSQIPDFELTNRPSGLKLKKDSPLGRK